mmetsp:Transcript_46805/g.100065  ORF Transcript_46805/g.100065 Transcript_46805/m.100065 type:complete len:485 (+) Transcript_46805:151-1605(+)
MAWRPYWALWASFWAVAACATDASLRHRGFFRSLHPEGGPGPPDTGGTEATTVRELQEHLANLGTQRNETLNSLKGDGWGKGVFSGNSSNSPFTTNKNEPFVHVDVFNVSQNNTVFRVEIATPNIIISVYLLMFVPIIMAWVTMHHFGTHDEHYLIILPITLCSMMVGQDLVNQSLSALMESPMAITFIQALSCAVMTGSWTVTAEMQKPTLSKASLWPLFKWTSVALLFSCYQLVNHLVSYTCSLSERTVFLNLGPVVSLAFESVVMPTRMQSPKVSFMGKLALSCMVMGAVLFSLQYPFTPTGAFSAVGLVAVVIPYRLLQRWLLVDCLNLPIYLLAAFDGLVLCAPSGIITYLNQMWFWRSWETWWTTPSIALMLVLSFATFTGNHVSALLLMRASSATNVLVFSNLSNFIVVLQGILFFGDQVSNPLIVAGILICLVSGVWYSIESGKGLINQNRKAPEPKDPHLSERNGLLEQPTTNAA